MCGTKPSTDTIAAAAGPYAKPAIRQTMPDGSYFSQVTGVIGNSMKLVTIASATNSAYMAIRRVDQRPESATPVVCEPSLALVLAVDVLAEPSASGATERTTCMRIREDTLIMSPRFFHPDYTVGSGISPDQPLARVAGFLPSPL